MNQKASFVLLFGIGMAFLPVKASADLAYAWDFAGLSATTPTTATPDLINATIGNATLDTSAFGLGSPQGTNPEKTSFGGAGTVNTFSGAESGTGTALAIANLSANGKSLLFTFSMTGYQDLVLSFATRGTSTGFNSGVWSWSTDGINYTTMVGVNTATRTTSFATATVDFTGVTALDNASTAYLKYTLDGATGSTGNNRIDNIQMNVAIAPVPEPSTMGLAFLGGLLMFGVIRRKR